MLKENYKSENAGDFVEKYELHKRVRELEKELEAERKKNASILEINNNLVDDVPKIPPADEVKAIHIGRGEGKPPREYAPVIRCKDCTAWVRNTGIADSPNGHCFEHGICTNGHDFCSYGERKEATP